MAPAHAGAPPHKAPELLELDPVELDPLELDPLELDPLEPPELELLELDWSLLLVVSTPLLHAAMPIAARSEARRGRRKERPG